MGKIHLLMRKEEIDPERILGKTVVVLDVLLATSTITSAIAAGAKGVIAAGDVAAAKKVVAEMEGETSILAGECGGHTIEGFVPPLPLTIQENMKNKTLVLTTTNGTIAIRKASVARCLYAGSLLNAKACAETVARRHPGETIVVVCAGSAGAFSLEDFYGAGCFLSNFKKAAKDDKRQWSDAALAALQLYEGHEQNAEKILASTRVGKMLMRQGLHDEVLYAARTAVLSAVPVLNHGILMNVCRVWASS